MLFELELHTVCTPFLSCFPVPLPKAPSLQTQYAISSSVSQQFLLSVTSKSLYSDHGLGFTASSTAYIWIFYLSPISQLAPLQLIPQYTFVPVPVQRYGYEKSESARVLAG